MAEFANTINAVALCVQAKVPVLLEGGVGTGKTSIVQAIFDEFCAEHHTSIVAIHEPMEYGGAPVPSRIALTPNGQHSDDGFNVVKMLPPEWVHRLAKVKAGKIAGLFLDEFSNGPPATRAATMRGVLDGVWGDTLIPELATVVAQNPPAISENGYRLSAPLSNRFVHIDWNMPVGYWANQLIRGFPKPTFTRLPSTWREHIEHYRPVLGGFAHGKPDSINPDLPAEKSKHAQPFPTFRSWTRALELLGACRAVGFDRSHAITLELLAGAVGGGAAAEFLAYATELDLPDPEIVIANPKALKLPVRGDHAWAVLMSVVMAVRSRSTIPRWEAGWHVLAIAVDQDRADIAAVAAKELAAEGVRPKGSQIPASFKKLHDVLRAAGVM